MTIFSGFMVVLSALWIMSADASSNPHRTSGIVIGMIVGSIFVVIMLWSYTRNQKRDRDNV